MNSIAGHADPCGCRRRRSRRSAASAGGRRGPRGRAGRRPDPRSAGRPAWLAPSRPPPPASTQPVSTMHEHRARATPASCRPRAHAHCTGSRPLRRRRTELLRRCRVRVRRAVRRPHGTPVHDDRRVAGPVAPHRRARASTGSRSGTTSTRPTSRSRPTASPRARTASKRSRRTPRSRRHHERVRCGSLVYCALYRHPAVLANAMATSTSCRTVV